MVAPAVPLYGFQRRWIADKNRFKTACVTRQGGKSFMIALDAVLTAAETAVNEIMLSAGERQSRELMEKVKMHCKAVSVAASAIEEDRYRDDDGNEYKQLSVGLNNGARIIGLPANPSTARGFTGNGTLDEFAFHRDTYAIWKALFPTVSRGFKLRVVSTPQGKQNKFYQVFTGDDNGFSKHFVDIYQAVKDGVPHDIEALQKAIGDEDAWEQEFLCKFLDEATAFLTYEMIAACETDQLRPEVTHETFEPSMLRLDKDGAVYIGVDIGRKRDHTIIWILQQLGDVFWTPLILRLTRQPFRVQRERLWEVITGTKATRVCIDATGLGAQLAEETVERFGTYRAEAVEFTAKTKNDMATRMRRTVEDRLLRIPVDQTLRNDLHSVKKTTTAAGNIRFDAERTKDGHADRFWAGALCLTASDLGAQPEVIIL